MLLVQGKIKVIEQENEMNKEENPLKGLKVSENLEDEKIKSLIENKVINAEDENFDKYYIINSETLNELKLQDNLKGEYYIVNYKTYEIIYSKGIEIKNEMHYTLTEILEHTDTEERQGRSFAFRNQNARDTPFKKEKFKYSCYSFVVGKASSCPFFEEIT